jgi:hypothetical protein
MIRRTIIATALIVAGPILAITQWPGGVDQECWDEFANCNIEINLCPPWYSEEYCYRCTANQVYDICFTVEEAFCDVTTTYDCQDEERADCEPNDKCATVWGIVGECRVPNPLECN